MSSKSKLKNKLERLEDKYTTEENKESDLGSVITLKEKDQIEDTDDPDIEDKINHMIEFHKDWIINLYSRFYVGIRRGKGSDTRV